MANYVKSFRVSVPDQVSSFAIPNLKRAGYEKKIVIKNTSAATTMRFNFENDGNDHYITLAPGATSVVFGGLHGGELIYTDGVGGAVTAEVLIWEE